MTLLICWLKCLLLQFKYMYSNSPESVLLAPELKLKTNKNNQNISNSSDSLASRGSNSFPGNSRNRENCTYTGTTLFYFWEKSERVNLRLTDLSWWVLKWSVFLAASRLKPILAARRAENEPCWIYSFRDKRRRGAVKSQTLRLFMWLNDSCSQRC